METLVAALFALLFGLAFAVFGYRLFLVLLPIWAFFAGFWLGAYGTTLILGSGFLATVTGWVLGLILGLIAAVLSYLFYLVGVAMIAFGFGTALGSGFAGVLGFDPGIVTTIFAVAAGVLVAALVLMLNLQKYIIIVMTALGGANLLVLAGLLVFGRITVESLAANGSSIGPIVRDSWFWLLAWLLLAILGIVIQLRISRNYHFDQAQYVEAWT